MNLHTYFNDVAEHGTGFWGPLLRKWYQDVERNHMMEYQMRAYSSFLHMNQHKQTPSTGARAPKLGPTPQKKLPHNINIRYISALRYYTGRAPEGFLRLAGAK